jgi:hypothetical protein
MRKDSRIVSKEDCAIQIEELRRKKLLIIALIKEFSAITEVEKWEFSPLSILCESYVYIIRMFENLNKIYIKNANKNQIKVTNDEIAIYLTYYAGLSTYGGELKHIYSININPEENVS